MFVSTYETFLGHEPNFTTWKKRTGAFKPGEAKMTIDYIFVSNECETVDVAALPGVEEIGHKALPCPEYPSDHLMLRAVVRLPERG
jgi:nocturnin